MKNKFIQIGRKGGIYAFLFLFLFSGTQIYAQKLMKYFYKGDYEKFVSLLKSKPKLVYEKNYSGHCSVDLLCASEDSIAYHYLETIFINCPAYNINVTNDNELTPLAYSMVGHINNVKLLIKKNVDVNLCFKTQLSPLIFAIICGNEPAAELLINNGAKINHQDGDNRTALIYASIYGYKITTQKLLTANADMNILDQKGNTALFYAAGLQYPDDKDTINDLRPKTDKEIVSMLIKKGAEINQTNSAYWIPLMYACQNNNYEIIETFLSSEVIKVNHQDREGITPLMLSCSVGDLKTVKLLIEHKADASIKDNSGKTAISYALTNNNSDVVSYLKKVLGQNK